MHQAELAGSIFNQRLPIKGLNFKHWSGERNLQINVNKQKAMIYMSGVEESSDKCKLARGNDLHEWGGGIFR